MASLTFRFFRSVVPVLRMMRASLVVPVGTLTAVSLVSALWPAMSFLVMVMKSPSEIPPTQVDCVLELYSTG